MRRIKSTEELYKKYIWRELEQKTRGIISNIVLSHKIPNIESENNKYNASLEECKKEISKLIGPTFNRRKNDEYMIVGAKSWSEQAERPADLKTLIKFYSENPKAFVKTLVECHFKKKEERIFL